MSEQGEYANVPVCEGSVPLLGSGDRSDSHMFDVHLNNGSGSDRSVSDDMYLDARSVSNASKSSLRSSLNNEGVPDAWSTAKRVSIYSLFATISAIFLFVAFAAIYHACVYDTYNSVPFVTSAAVDAADALTSVGQEQTMINTLAARGFGTKENPIVVDFLGDSILNKAQIDYDLFSQIEDILTKETSLQFHMINRGVSSACNVNCTLTQLNRYISTDKPNVIIMFSNSDVSYSEPDWGELVWSQYLQNYSVALQTVIDISQAAVGDAMFAVAGPSMFSEGPWFQPARMKGFGFMINDIRNINIDIVKKNAGVVYIDQLGAMQSIAVSWWKLYSLYSTKDGEHLSELGSKIFAANCARFLLS